MEGGGRERLRDPVVQLARHPDALLIGGRVPRLDHQEVLLEHAHDLTAEDQADHEVVGDELRLVEGEQTGVHALADHRHREHVARLDAAGELGMERLSAPGEQSASARCAPWWAAPSDRSRQRKAASRSGSATSGRQRAGVVPLADQLAVVPHHECRARAPRCPPRRSARAARAGSRRRSPASRGRILELAVTLPGKSASSTSPRRSCPSQVPRNPSSTATNARYEAADDEAVELEVGDARNRRGRAGRRRRRSRCRSS